MTPTHITVLLLSTLSLQACGGIAQSGETKSDPEPLASCINRPIPAGACDALSIPKITCSRGNPVPTCTQPECGRFAWKVVCEPVAPTFDGIWGGPHVELQVQADGLVTLNFDCASGRFGPVVLDALGAFRVNGTRLAGSGVQLPPGAPRPTAVSVVYTGQITKETLTLFIASPEPGSSQERYELVRGARGTLNRCL
jgi:hypothetical protein